MEQFLSSLNSVIATWLSSSLTPWVTDTIFGLLCGLGLFLLLLPFFEMSSGAEVAQEQEEKENIESHLERLPNECGFRQRSCQDLSGEVCKANPAGAQQPCGEPVEVVAPVMIPLASPAPLTEHPLPLSSSLSPSPRTSSFSFHSCSSVSASQPPEPFLPLDGLLPQPLTLSTSTSCLPDSEAHPPLLTASSAPPPQDSTLILPKCDSVSWSPHMPWSASPIPAMSGLDHSSCSISTLSRWQMDSKAHSLSTSTHFKSQQEQVSHHLPEDSSRGHPTDKQIETSTLSFFNPDVRKPISGRVELKIWNEKEKKEGSDYHLDSLRNMIKSLGDEQDALWGMKGKPEKLLGPEKHLHPEIFEANLQQKCSQLFWGLPFLHSESLVATVRETPPEFPSVIFNEFPHALPLQIRHKVTSHLTLEQPLPHPVTQPKLLTPAMPPFQPPPLAQIQTQTHLPPFSPPQTRTSGDVINPEILEQLEQHLQKRTWHSEIAMEVEKESLEPNPSSVVAKTEPRKESGDVLASRGSLFSSKSISSGDMSASKVLNDFISSGGSSQQESLRLQDQSKSQSTTFIPTYEKENNGRPKPGEHKEKLAEMRTSQDSGISAALSKKSEASPASSCRRNSKSCQLMQKEQPPPESFLKNRIKYFLQWMFPRKDKGLKDDPHKGQPASATDQSCEPVKSRSIMGSRAAEAQ
ncbi:spermatogenesis-associated protein 31A6-like, partial [Pteropus medius]|uniref:spermatogenesis-associated protein 31A6-like n=1 Tax=Pteropus vampyrus TaxID=132908 RepID=UPI00196A2469